MWFYAKNGEQHGPVEADDLRSRLKSGDLSNGTLVWREGMAQWTPLGEVLELREPVPAATVEAAPAGETESVPSPSQPQPATRMVQPSPQLVAPVQQNTMALVSMILGIVSVVFCTGGFLTGIPAIICGHIARKQFRNSPTPQTGEGMATAGLILGYLMTILSILVIVAYIVFVVVAVGSAATSASPMPVPSPSPSLAP
ncbi:DUF4190 domain-containing protein [Roseibacillus persicicus]|uniref:GYF domain-containing protein n=1 Tax=Roseibacillus persicicus TaxID=454148 RepID=A0A918WQ83_9BACT|nr:DUF4190 domain-containing protein [Roseibacillus persicicus]MDQ8191736.1 DUF4190 domain-containing protein [Roseibacillus persicicus]GHC63789.1 hypothetical protein GCM10007100_34190 [Roseibacillus persicicus]